MVLAAAVMFVVGCNTTQQRKEEPAQAPLADIAPEPAKDTGQAAHAAEPVEKVKPAEPASPGVGAPRTYTVQRGDTLYSIARKFYGDGKHFRRILDANQNKISDPNKIKPGTNLVIP